MDYSQLFNTMIVFIALMTIGYAGARMKVLTRDFSKAASKLVMNIFLSASVLNSVIGDQPGISGKELWNTILLLFLVFFICYGCGAVLVRLFRADKKDVPVMELLMSVPNTMFVGLPIVQELYGATAVLYMALSCIPFNVILYSYGIWRLKSSDDDSSLRIKDMLTVPLIVTLISVVIFVFHIELPAVVVKLTTTLAPATMPMSMIVIGATLGSVNLLDAFREKRCYIVCFVRLLVAPIITWLVLSLFTADPVLLATSVVIAGCPSGVVITVLALEYDHDPVLSSKGVLAATSLSMLTLPLLVTFLV